MVGKHHWCLFDCFLYKTFFSLSFRQTISKQRAVTKLNTSIGKEPVVLVLVWELTAFIKTENNSVSKEFDWSN